MVKVKIIKRYSDVLFRRTVEVGEVLDVTQERANHLVCEKVAQIVKKKRNRNHDPEIRGYKRSGQAGTGVAG